MRKLALGVTLIVLFTAGAVGAVWFLTRDEEPPVAATPGPAPAEAPVPAPQPSWKDFQPSSAAPPPPVPAVVVLSAPRYEPPKGTWEAVPVVARLSALGPMAGPIGRGLIELKPRISDCWSEDTAARYGPTPPTVGNDASVSDANATVLVLHVEASTGEARIVDAPLESQGSASDGVVTCAQQVLRGRRFAAPGVTASGKYRVLYPLER